MNRSLRSVLIAALAGATLGVLATGLLNFMLFNQKQRMDNALWVLFPLLGGAGGAVGMVCVKHLPGGDRHADYESGVEAVKQQFIEDAVSGGLEAIEQLRGEMGLPYVDLQAKAQAYLNPELAQMIQQLGEPDESSVPSHSRQSQPDVASAVNRTATVPPSAQTVPTDANSAALAEEAEPNDPWGLGDGSDGLPPITLPGRDYDDRLQSNSYS